MKKRSENVGGEVRLKTNTGREMEITSEHSFCVEISEKTYDICELLAFKLGKMPEFTWGAA